MATWQESMLVDDDSEFLRQVNEVSRTGFLRSKKIQQVIKTLEAMDSRREPISKLVCRIQQLSSMTLLQQEGETTSDPCVSSLASLLRDSEAAIKNTEESYQLLQQHRQHLQEGVSSCVESHEDVTNDKQESYPSSMSDPQAVAQEHLESAHAQADAGYKQLINIMDSLDSIADDIFDAKYVAEDDLKNFETEMLHQWQQKKSACEQSWKRWAAVIGARHALKAGLERYDMHTPGATDSVAMPEEERQGGGLASSEPDCVDSGVQLAAEVGEGMDMMPRDGYSDEPEGHIGASLHVLSDYLPEGSMDPKQREEILKRNHPGSQDHPHGCRPCHFQGGLCWKGLACSFCHICPKPKRKSKHQRDVDKRRQERYRQVKDNLGVECLDELTKIDDSRRQIMTSSEELKQLVKDAYATGLRSKIDEVQYIVDQIQKQSDHCRAMVPVIPHDGDDDDEDIFETEDGMPPSVEGVPNDSSAAATEVHVPKTKKLAGARNAQKHDEGEVLSKDAIGDADDDTAGEVVANAGAAQDWSNQDWSSAGWNAASWGAWGGEANAASTGTLQNREYRSKSGGKAGSKHRRSGGANTTPETGMAYGTRWLQPAWGQMDASQQGMAMYGKGKPIFGAPYMGWGPPVGWAPPNFHQSSGAYEIGYDANVSNEQ